MVPILSLAEHLLARGRRLRSAGLFTHASQPLEKVLSLPGQTMEISAETHAILAEMSLRRRKYSRARRQLRAALDILPSCPHFLYLMGCALEQRQAELPASSSRLEMAAASYLACLEHDTNHIAARTALGALRVRQGRMEEGLSILRYGLSLAPDRFESLLALYCGLRRSGCHREARELLGQAKFRFRGNLRFRMLESRVQFRRSMASQRRQAIGQPRVIPFLRIADPIPEMDQSPSNTTRILRQDGPGMPSVPFALRKAFRKRSS